MIRWEDISFWFDGSRTVRVSVCCKDAGETPEPGTLFAPEELTQQFFGNPSRSIIKTLCSTPPPQSFVPLVLE